MACAGRGFYGGGERGGRGRDRVRSLMGSVLDRLEEREAQTRDLVERLRA
jgi:hypothetical protein